MCYLLFAFAYMIEPFMYVHSCYATLDHKVKNKLLHFMSGVLLFFMVVVKQAFLMSGHANIYTVFFVPIFISTLLVLEHILYSDKMRKKVLIILFICVLSLVGEGIFCGLFFLSGISSETLFQVSYEGALLTCMVKLVTLLLYFTTYKLVENWKMVACTKDIPMIFLFTVILIIFVGVSKFYLAKSNSVINMISYVVEAIILLVFCYYICKIFIEKSNSLKEADTVTQLMQQQLYVVAHAKELYSKLRSARHDTRAHYEMIRKIATNIQATPILEYLDQIYSVVDEAETIAFFDNDVLTVLISNKLGVANKNAIAFDVDIKCTQLPLSSSEQLSLLSNLLNNAFEAVLKIQEETKRYIQLEMYKIYDEIHISCKNAIGEAVMQGRDNEYLTTKKDKEEHGIGIHTMRDIIRRNHGEIHFTHNEEEFCVDILIRDRGGIG